MTHNTKQGIDIFFSDRICRFNMISDSSEVLIRYFMAHLHYLANPFTPSRLFRQSKLDESIFNYSGVWLI